MVNTAKQMTQQRLKILLSGVSAKSGGAATYLRNLAGELPQSKHQYVLYVPPNLAKAVRSLGNNLTVVATDIAFKSSWRRFLWDQVVLRWIINKQKVNVFVSSSDFGVLFPPCQQILLIRNPLFFSDFYLQRILPQKSWRFRIEFLLRRKLISLSAKSSDVVIAASESMLQDVRRFIMIPNGKAVVNYFGVPLERFNGKGKKARKRGSMEAGTSQEGPLRMLYVSEYSDYKNLTTLLKAVVLLRDQGIGDFCLTTTADPSQFPDVEITTRREDKALASDPRVAPYVKFTGSVPYRKMHTLYQDSDLFVFPSLAESFGHPLVEAMATELPIITSDIPIHREICGEAAVYFSPLSPKDLVDKILLLRGDPDLRRRLGQIGRKRAEERFDWKDHVRRLVEIIEEVVTHARG